MDILFLFIYFFRYLIFEKRIFKTMEVAKTEGQQSNQCRPNVADRLETEANFSGCGGVSGVQVSGRMVQRRPGENWSKENPQVMVPRLWVWDSKSMPIDLWSGQPTSRARGSRTLVVCVQLNHP